MECEFDVVEKIHMLGILICHLLMGLKDVVVSSGSTCTNASLEPSYVLIALGVEEDMAHTVTRLLGLVLEGLLRRMKLTGRFSSRFSKSRS